MHNGGVREEFQHFALLVSGAEDFFAFVKKFLPKLRFASVEEHKSASSARRCVLERYYDLVVINAPLPDENGIDFALDITENCNASVLLVVPKEIYEEVLDRVTDCGVFVMPKPSQRGMIEKSLRFLTAICDKIYATEKKLQNVQEKMEELRTVDRAKFMLIEKKGLTEDDAHRLIGKLAMDNGVSRGRVARRMLDDME